MFITLFQINKKKYKKVERILFSFQFPGDMLICQISISNPNRPQKRRFHLLNGRSSDNGENMQYGNLPGETCQRK